MPKTDLREAEYVLCCDECETPLAEVIHCIQTTEGLKEINRDGSGQYCTKCECYRIGLTDSSFLDFCPDCKCKLEKKNKLQSQCPKCKQLFKTG